MSAHVQVDLFIPPAENRGWPGKHELKLRHDGGPNWHHIVLTGAGWDYCLHITPWQLIKIVAAMVLMAVNRRAKILYRNAWHKLKHQPKKQDQRISIAVCRSLFVKK